MRPGQQNNKRMRGRGGRKGPNPLSRSYESNGPDVKIRGTAQHIAERYATLARDATSAGDRVMAENYFQHAEHYGRIVAAAQGSFQPAQAERDYDSDEDEGEEGGEFAVAQAPDNRNGNNNGQYRERGDGQQRNDGQPRGDNNQRRDRDNNREFRGDRPDRDNREFRGENGRDGRDNREGRERNFRDRRDERSNNGQSYGRDGADGTNGERRDEDRAPRNERRFENRTRTDDAQPGSEDANSEDRAFAASQTPAAQPEAAAEAAPRRRGRPPRPRYEEPAESQPTNGEVPSADPQSPASVSADSEAATDATESAPRRRGRPPRAAQASEAVEEASAEAPVKRRPGRPRKVRAEDEGGEPADASELPAFLLASSS